MKKWIKKVLKGTRPKNGQVSSRIGESPTCRHYVRRFSLDFSDETKLNKDPFEKVFPYCLDINGNFRRKDLIFHDTTRSN